MIKMNGMKEEVIMGKLKQLIFDDNIEIVFVTETHLTKSKQATLGQMFCDYDIFVRRRKKKKNKQYQARGGVVCIARKGVATLRKETTCDDLLCVKWRDFVVICAYFVPP